MLWQHESMSITGRLLVATPLIEDPNFFHTAVFIYAHEEDDGAAGVVVNRPTDEPTISHLPEWKGVLAPPPSVFWGGPVAMDTGVVLIVENGAIRVAESALPPEGDIKARLFIGQAGWGPGQLEAEIAEGAWLTTEADPADVISTFPDQVWPGVLRRLGGTPALWATHPADPRSN